MMATVYLAILIYLLVDKDRQLLVHYKFFGVTGLQRHTLIRLEFSPPSLDAGTLNGVM
jgi:hypothetical protein